MAGGTVEVEIFNCRLKLELLDGEIAERLRQRGVDPEAALRELVQRYEAGELLYGGTVCPVDCDLLAMELEMNYPILVYVLDDNLPCPG